MDPPQTSEDLRTQLSLPFPLLCDTEHRVIESWNVLNERERGGIARPAIFVLDSGLRIRFSSIDHVVRRAPAAQIVSLLQQPSVAEAVHRKPLRPLVSHWIRAIRNIRR